MNREKVERLLEKYQVVYRFHSDSLMRIHQGDLDSLMSPEEKRIAIERHRSSIQMIEDIFSDLGESIGECHTEKTGRQV